MKWTSTNEIWKRWNEWQNQVNQHFLYKTSLPFGSNLACWAGDSPHQQKGRITEHRRGFLSLTDWYKLRNENKLKMKLFCVFFSCTAHLSLFLSLLHYVREERSNQFLMYASASIFHFLCFSEEHINIYIQSELEYQSKQLDLCVQAAAMRERCCFFFSWIKKEIINDNMRL